MEQLNCGSRSFDYRPFLLENGTLIAHHGGVTIPYPMRTSMQQVMNWCHENPLEMVIVYLSHFDGDIDGCMDATINLMKSLGLNYYFNLWIVNIYATVAASAI